MADLSDAENTFKSLIVGWVYPTGTANPSAILDGGSPVPTKVGRGWPTKNALQADLLAKVANISIYSQPGSERLTTRYPREWQQLGTITTTLTATVSGRTITIGGAVSAPQNVAVLIGSKAYVYPVQPGDTLATIAAALASIIEVGVSATSSGPVITVSGDLALIGRVGGFGTVMRELRRQERLFQITVWCWSPEQRDAVASFIDIKFAGAGQDNGLEFITLPDGSSARLKYVRTAPADKDELSGAFRRDLIYSLEYATTETMTAPQIVAFETKIEDPSANIIIDQTV